MTVKFAKHVTGRRSTKQSEPIPGEPQVKNNAGGYVYSLDKWARLTRFLILGTDGGTYYVKERDLTRDNAAVVEVCLAEDAERTVANIVDVSETGRAPKNDQAVFALALAAAVQNPDAAGMSSADIRKMALDQLPKVCRIPTHLFQFMESVKAFRGFGRGMRNAIAAWYERWDEKQLAYELVKYQARDGWSHRDVLRLAHVRPRTAHQAAFRWAIGASLDRREVARPKGSEKAPRIYGPTGELPAVIAAFEEAKTLSAQAGVKLIREHGLTREMVPTEWLNHAYVWEALLEKMPLTAMIRNLAKMTAVELLKPMSDATNKVISDLGNTERLRKSRVHPLAILNALRVYSQGKGDKGSLTWKPVGQIVDALDAAFYASFKNVEPTGKRILLALDVSGSMGGSMIAGTGLSAREGTAALCLVTANVEPNYAIVGFTGRGTHYGSGKKPFGWGSYTGACEPLAISPRQRLDDVVKYLTALPMGITDCAQPMLYANANKMDVDAFITMTDNETWAGDVHPSQALRDYRSKRGIHAKNIVVGMTATQFSIADPADPASLDVVGFDLLTPQAMSEFIKQ